MNYQGKYQTFTIPELDKNGFAFEVQNINKLIMEPWNPANYSDTHAPIVITQLSPQYPNAPSILDLPIKFPKTEYRVPDAYKKLENLLKVCATFEALINPKIDEYYAYLTVDQRTIKAGTTQRSPGAHVDGLQGARINPKRAAEHGYLYYDKLPPTFFEHPFNLSALDLRYDNFSDAFDSQIDMRKARKYPTCSLLFFHAYCVHRSEPADIDTERLFVRVFYSTREFDRLGNTHNPMFDYHWEMVDRDFVPQPRP